MAAACHDGKVYIFSLGAQEIKLAHTLKGSKQFVSHVDWSCDSRFLRTNDGSYDLLYYDISTGKQEPFGNMTLKDTEWQTQSCTISWATQGIWSKGLEGTDINHCDKSKEKHADGYGLLACGDDFGKVKLFRYPCMVEPSLPITLNGHCSHVTKVKFGQQNEYLFAAGGNDSTVI